MKSRHAAVIVLATLMTCAFVWVRLQIVSISYDINELAKQERVSREECSNLSLRINEAKSPQRLENLAINKFGMGAPRVDQIVVMSESGK